MTVDPTIDRTALDQFGQTINEGMNHTLAWISDPVQNASTLGIPLREADFTEKEWAVVQILTR